jgi:RNA polymerase sigma factor (sigma-70 family)
MTRRTESSRTGSAEHEAADDAALVRACLNGDEAAWSALIARYRRLIYSIPVRYGASPEDAGDIFQAVCLDLFSELPQLRRVESLRSWLMTVTAHHAFHWKRRHQLRASREAGPPGPDDEPAVAEVSSELLQAAEREQQLREAVARLPPRCQQLIQLLFFAQPPLAYAEAARRLGLATGSIGFVRGRCLRKLQRELKAIGFEP